MTHTTLTKPAESNEQIREYLSAVDKGLAGRFVMQNGNGGWYVRKPNAHKGTLYPTKAEAIAKAKNELASTKGELFIFNKDGHLTERQ